MNRLEKYKVSIKYIDGETEVVEFVTPNILMTMDQYQRNRDFLSWEVLPDEDVQLEKDIKNGLYGEEY